MKTLNKKVNRLTTELTKRSGVPIFIGIAFCLLSCMSASGQCTYYRDFDTDGFGNPALSIIQPCPVPPVGYSTDNTDCDDLLYQYADNDGDGFGFGSPVACGVSNNVDCNDALQIFRDDDGDGFGSQIFVACGGAGTATNNLDCNDAQMLYADNDGDGWGAGALVPCGGVTNNLDCDDTPVSGLTYDDNDGDGFGAGALVPCGGVTNNLDCDDSPFSLTYADTDGDGWGFGALTPCGVDNNLDCDDNFRNYEDNDGDGFGYPAGPLPCGGVFNNIDCDDFATLYPDDDGDGFGFGIPVPCNGVTNNLDCDDTPVSGLRYADVDNDGFGSMTVMVACGGVTNNLDCDDLDTQYEDNDNDGYGSAVKAPCSNIDRNDDCNDNSSAVHPGATELLCDGIDNDCNGVIDAGAPPLIIDAGPNKIVYRGYADSSCTRLQSSGVGGGIAPRTLTWSNGSHAAFINVCPTTTTVYYLTVTDANGCSKTDSVKVCVIDVRCGNNNKSVIICHGTGSATNPYTTLCVGKTETNSHFLNHPGEQLGPCGMVKTCNWPVQERLETEGLQDGMEYIGAFPNPFSNTTTIRFMLPENDFANVKVFDVTGRVVENIYEGETKAGNIYDVTFDGSKFSNGIYFLLLNSRSGVSQTRKLILSK